MPSKVHRRIANRIHAVMIHIPRYSFMGQARLAEDAGVSRSAVSRMLSGKSSPSMALVMALLSALEMHLGRRMDPRELVSLDGTFPTLSVCELCGCPGCLPEEAYDLEGNLRPEYSNCRPGTWIAGTAANTDSPAVAPPFVPDTS